MITRRPIIPLIVLICVFFSACGMSKITLDTTASQVAATATQTPTATATPTVKFTPMPSDTPTPNQTATAMMLQMKQRATQQAETTPTVEFFPPLLKKGLSVAALTLDDLPTGFEAVYAEELKSWAAGFNRAEVIFGFGDARYGITTEGASVRVDILSFRRDKVGVFIVGLVTDTSGVNDKAFNQSAWASVQKAQKEFGFNARYIESRQPTDYEKNIDQFAAENYDVIITVSFRLSDATAVKARQYPNIKFAMIDNAYTPTQDSAACPDTVKDCYDDGGLKNVTSLMFQEDQVGFLAGVLAGGMT